VFGINLPPSYPGCGGSGGRGGPLSRLDGSGDFWTCGLPTGFGGGGGGRDKSTAFDTID
jgi:hypothetical protein